MEVFIREGSIEDALRVEKQIPEYPRYNDIKDYRATLTDKRHLILVAQRAELDVGFKVGYDLGDCNFYSWIGGVLPKYRHFSIATKLMLAQELWAKNQGYKQILVHTYKRFPSMISMLSKSGYENVGLDTSDVLEKHRLHFIKQLECK